MSGESSKTPHQPVMQPTKFELITNLKTAKALGRRAANAVACADEVIE
jgi:hypothetical protein